ncbi:hypothetical protein F5883DRAFT_458203 [Diaporthe sp. PMI_573]|nr:hypothetical protein F5883DRAFT_458203 [Diaporthaceae sp. PMI_573]
MVNTGHPSRACKLCRARRIKCDETKPHCIKCRKSKRQCPGYRDPFEINLRDETQSTIRKAKAAAAQRRTSRQDDRETSSDESPTKSTHSASGSSAQGRRSPHASDGSWETLTQSAWSSPSSQVASLNRSSRSPTFSNGFGVFDFTYSFNAGGSSVAPVCPGLQTPLDEQATCFFLSNFVLTLSTGQNPGLFSFALKILQAPGIKETPFPMAFTAVSLAALAGRPNSRHLLPKSQIYYSTALVQLKEVLQDKKRATDDATLATAILLSFYEGLASDNESMAGWSNHLDGAKALIRLRGKDVITESTPEGLEMFQLVRSMSIRQNMFGFVANPSVSDVEWWGQHVVSDKSGHVALVLNMKTTLIRAEADALLTSGPKTAGKIDKALDLLRRAREIVTELGRWLENCHPTWPKFVSGWAKEISDDRLDKAATFPGPLYTFPNVWVAGKHLNTNASRILLAGIIVRCVRWICAPSDHTKTDDYAEAMRIGCEEVTNVIASVPYFVTWQGDRTTTPYFPCGAPTSPKAYSGVTALYPLLCTGLSEFVTPRQKKWLCGRLMGMSEAMGIKQAEVFSKFISNQAPPVAA